MFQFSSMIKATISDFLQFLKRPDDCQANTAISQRFRVLLILILLEIAVTFAVLVPFDYLLSNDSLTENSIYNSWSILKRFGILVIIIPFIEECIFRFFLRYNGLKTMFISRENWDKIFPMLVYLSSITFGFVHLANYLYTEDMLCISAVFVVLSPLIGGFILAYIRVRLNFPWSVLYHSVWNFLFAIALPIIEDPSF